MYVVVTEDDLGEHTVIAALTPKSLDLLLGRREVHYVDVAEEVEGGPPIRLLLIYDHTWEAIRRRLEDCGALPPGAAAAKGEEDDR